ncbi:hypothetical protein C8R46DRAFT_863046, partial [Mycena filopes]
LAARDVLLARLPLELVYIVLDHAECWVSQTSARGERREVRASSTPGHDASLLYLVGEPILGSGRVWVDGEEGVEELDIPLRLTRVRFTVTSRDQGWGGEAHIRGTYHGHTWFDAAVLHPTSPDTSALTPATLPWMNDAVAVTGALSEGAELWAVQRNVCASREVRTHSVVWDADGACVPEPGIDSGAGDGRGFVRGLAAGDRIVVFARAKYPQWVNIVHSVEVTAYYAL